jgi:hypothetical protein
MQCFDEVAKEPLSEGALALDGHNCEVAEYPPELAPVSELRVTPPDLAMWLPNFHHQGRTDLDAITVTQRRDSFLATALRQIP